MYLSELVCTAVYCLDVYICFILHVIDIGANLTDLMYQGQYHGSKKHEPDLDVVLARSWAGGLQKMIITGGNLNDSKTALELSQTDCK